MKNMTLQTMSQTIETHDSELHELFLDELAEMLNAEQQLMKALPKMARAAMTEQLSRAFESHLVETEYHVTRLEQVFARRRTKAQTCAASQLQLAL